MGARDKIGHYGNKINFETDTLGSIVMKHVSIIKLIYREYT